MELILVFFLVWMFCSLLLGLGLGYIIGTISDFEQSAMNSDS